MPRLPVPLAGIALGIGAVLAFNLGAFGVALLGPMPGGSLHFALPSRLSWEDWTTFVPSSAGVAVLTFCSAMAAGRSFAAKNGYAINANRDFVALGLANISSGLTQGFCISGAESRTAINDSVRGRTQIVGIVSALATAAVLLFFTAPLANVPNCALGAVLIFAGVGLIDIPGTLRLRHCHVLEFGLSIVATLGVILLGVLPGLAIAIALALFILLRFSSHPREAILGLVPGLDGYNDIAGHPDARTVPGTLIYRFEAPLVFYNVENFTTRVRALVSAAPEPLRFFFTTPKPRGESIRRRQTNCGSSSRNFANATSDSESRARRASFKPCWNERDCATRSARTTCSFRSVRRLPPGTPTFGSSPCFPEYD